MNVATSRQLVAHCSDQADVVELGLLLPGGQAAALEAAAHCRGLTTGQLLRRLLRDFLATSGRSRGL